MSSRQGRHPFLLTPIFLAIVTAPPGAIGQSYSIIDLGLGRAYSLNESGAVVGEMEPPSRLPFLWDAGVKTSLPVLWAFSFPMQINDNGTIVGFAVCEGTCGPPGRNQAILWEGGVITQLGWPDPGIHQSFGYGINNLGQVVGEAWQGSGPYPQKAYRWQGGSWDMLDPLLTWARRANELGEVVGGGTVGGGITALRWYSGSRTDLGVLPGDSRSAALDINEGSEIVGRSGPSDWGDHAFVWRAGAMSQLPGFGPGQFAGAHAINDLGQAVGWVRYPGPGSELAAALWRDGVVIDLNTEVPSCSGWWLHFAEGINNQGQIVGTGSLNGDLHAFLLDPVSPLSLHGPPCPIDMATVVLDPQTQRPVDGFDVTVTGSLTAGADCAPCTVAPPVDWSWSIFATPDNDETDRLTICRLPSDNYTWAPCCLTHGCYQASSSRSHPAHYRNMEGA